MAFQIDQINVKAETFLVRGALEDKGPITVEISMNGWPAESWTIQEIGEAAEAQALKQGAA